MAGRARAAERHIDTAPRPFRVPPIPGGSRPAVPRPAHPGGRPDTSCDHLMHMAEREPRPSATRTSTRPRPPKPAEAARRACEQLDSLIVHETEGVSGVTRDEDGWVVSVDVLEVARIPDTTSLLATYEVHIDQRGELQEYRRVRRYRRGAADDC
ncbi:hypothetical protein GCM10009548_21980 [Streptomyces malaysiensis subsp. malaysiensis]